jgi:hypothetical protein
MVAKSLGSTFLFVLLVHFDCFGLLQEEAILTSFYNLNFIEEYTSFNAGTLAYCIFFANISTSDIKQ